MRAPKQKRARASEAGDPLVTVRLPAHLLASVKALAKEKGINRSAAVCALLELGLRAAPSDKGFPRPTSCGTRRALIAWPDPVASLLAVWTR
jgi:hypothetical protein